MTHVFIDISPTLIWNRRTIRMHEDFACEISLLPGKCVPFWLPTPPVQPLQAHLESLEEETRPSSSAIFYGVAASRFLAGAHVEGSYTALPRSFAPGLELSVSSDPGSFCVSAESCKSARTTDSSDRRPLLSLQSTPLGAVFDGLETLLSEPRCFPGPSALCWSGGNQLLVANHQHHSGQSAKARSSVGVRPNSRHHLLGHTQRLGLAALSLSPHQPAARQPGKAKEKSRRQNHA